MNHNLLLAAKILWTIYLFVPVAVLVVGKIRKKALISEFFKGIGLCLGICLIALPFCGILQLLIVLLPSAMLIAFYAIYRNDFQTRDTAVSFFWGIAQFGVCLCATAAVLMLDELGTKHDAVCDCYYERIGNIGSADEYIAAVLVRMAILILAAFVIYKLYYSKKFSGRLKAAVSSVISVMICIPIEIMLI